MMWAQIATALGCHDRPLQEAEVEPSGVHRPLMYILHYILESVKVGGIWSIGPSVIQ